MKNETVTKGKAWLRREMRPYRFSVLSIAALTVFATLLSLSFSYMIRFVINGAAEGSKKTMWVFSAVCAVVALLRVALQTVKSYLSERCKAKIVTGLRSRLFSRLLLAEYAEAEKYHSGDLLNRMTTDVSEVAATSVGILPAVAGMIAQCVGAITALLLLDPLFTAIFTACGVILAVCSSFFRKATKKYQKRLSEADGKNRSFIQESASALVTVKAYGAEGRTAKKSDETLDEYFSARMKKNRLNVALGGSFSLLSALSTVFAVVWCGVQTIKSGSGDYGSILSVIMLLSQLQQPFASFSAVLPACYSRAAAAERLAETDDLPAERSAESETNDRKKKNVENFGGVLFDGVRFSYAGREETLKGGVAYVPFGGITCVTGRSGSGKSTLFKLLLRVYKPLDGGIYLCSLPQKEGGETKIPVTAEHRSLFAYVPQGNFLFSGSIYENLTFFAPANVGEEAIRSALQTACAEFVYDLPCGLDTSLKERGGGLSEGQLQRLAVARALLSDRPVLLLDEATSALDETTEKRMLENIRALRNKTCLIVTHRPAALTLADEVICVEDGVLSCQKRVRSN